MSDRNLQHDLREALKDPMLIFALSCIPIVLIGTILWAIWH